MTRGFPTGSGVKPILDELIRLAEQVRLELAVEADFEASLTARNRYNDTFARFQVAVAGGAVIGPELVTELARLDQLHSANMVRVEELKQVAREALGTARTFRSRIGGYAPNGANNVPVARFVDGAA
jgi:hypothetical protein